MGIVGRGLSKEMQDTSLPLDVIDAYRESLVPGPEIRRQTPILPQYSGYEAAEASFRAAQMETGLTSLKELFKTYDKPSEDNPIVSVEQANEEARGYIDTPITEPLTRQKLNHIIEQGKEKNYYGEKVALGPQGYSQKGLNFAAGMLAHAIDPVELGASLAVGGLIGIAARGGYFGVRAAQTWSAVRGAEAIHAARAAQLAESLGAAEIGAIGRGLTGAELTASTITQDAIVNLTEGVLGNAAVEPVIYSASRERQMDYTAMDVFMSVAGGTLGFVGASSLLRYGFGKFISQMKSLNIDEAAKIANTGRIANDKIPNFKGFEEHYRERIYGERPADFTIKGTDIVPAQYKHSPIQKGEDVTGREFFAVSKSNKPDFKRSSITNLEEDYGRGVYLTDDPGVANNWDGKRVFHFQAKEKMNLIDMNSSLDDGKTISAIAKNIAEFFNGNIKKAEDFIRGNTLKNVFNFVEQKLDRNTPGHQVLYDNIQGDLRALGYDGYHTIGGELFGERVPGADHNMLMLFNEKKLNEIKSFEPDHSRLPEPNGDQIKAMQKEYTSKESDYFYDKETDNKIVEDSKKEINTEKKSTEIKTEADQKLKEAAETLDEPQVESLKTKEALLVAKHRDTETVVKLLKSCLTRGVA